MNFALRVLALGHSQLCEISSDQFTQIVRAREQLTLFGTFTENYRVVLHAYEHLEDEVHYVALRHLLHGFGAYTESLSNRISLNSAVIGYLAAARYFLDSADKLLPRLIPQEAFDRFVSFRSSIYDANKEYKFVEALRNYVQHRGLPIEGMTHHNFVEDTKNHESSDLVTAVSLLASRAKLQEDEKFKKQALFDMPESIDIIFCIRAHMAGLWRLHDFILKDHAGDASSARAVLQEHRNNFESNVGGSLVGLHAVKASDDDTIERKTPMLLDWDDARLESLKHLGNLSKLQRWYVSGKIRNS